MRKNKEKEKAMKKMAMVLAATLLVVAGVVIGLVISSSEPKTEIKSAPAVVENSLQIKPTILVGQKRGQTTASTKGTGTVIMKGRL